MEIQGIWVWLFLIFIGICAVFITKEIIVPILKIATNNFAFMGNFTIEKYFWHNETPMLIVINETITGTG